MSQLPESNSTDQTYSGSGDNVSRDKNDTSYFSEIGGDFKGIQGDISGGVINQYIITQKSGLEITSQPLIKGSPYLGLRKFEVDDKDKFFGRDCWIVELTNYLAKENVLLLLGASGSGKSSLIQAGLIPNLKDQWGSQLFNFTFVPDVDPFESFYGCLLTKYKQSEAKLARTIKEDTLIQVVQTLKNDAQWLIFIDQFEEVFTRTPKTERDIFIKSLIQLIENSDNSVKVIMTMRADFLDKLSPYPDLGKVHDSSSRMLTDMEDSDLRLAIAEPAARNGVIFEQGLIDTIIADFHQQAGSLPLLQYTLNLLWSKSKEKDDLQDRTLNSITYNDLGGVTGALQQQADDIYYNSKNEKEKLNGLERKAAEQIFLGLISLKDKEPVSRRADKSKFCDDNIRESALEKLINNRLLVVSKGEDGKATVEVAHEALLRSWKVLEDLIREREKIIILSDLLDADAKRWDEVRKQDSQKANSELWSGSKLERVVELRNEQALPNLDEVEIAFIEASVAERDRRSKNEQQKKLLLNIILGMIGLTVTIPLTIAGNILWNLSHRQNVIFAQPEKYITGASIYGLSYSRQYQRTLEKRGSTNILNQIVFGIPIEKNNESIDCIDVGSIQNEELDGDTSGKHIINFKAPKISGVYYVFFKNEMEYTCEKAKTKLNGEVVEDGQSLFKKKNPTSTIGVVIVGNFVDIFFYWADIKQAFDDNISNTVISSRQGAFVYLSKFSFSRKLSDQVTTDPKPSRYPDGTIVRL